MFVQVEYINTVNMNPGQKVPGHKVPKLVTIGHKVAGPKYNLETFIFIFIIPRENEGI